VLVGPVALAAACGSRPADPTPTRWHSPRRCTGRTTYTELAITGDLARYDGSSERWFPLLWALVTISGALLAS
jgi:hypothetical protein